MYQQIAANKRKTVFMMVFFVVLVAGLGWLFGEYTGQPAITPYVLIGAGVYVLLSYLAGTKMALGSFIWFVKDGMVLDPLRHRYILEQLNIANWPYRYRDLERLAKFQNRWFAKYAATHGLAYLDVEARLPLEAELFADAVHHNYPGIRLRGWVVLQELIPLIEKRLADKSWPRQLAAPEPPLPTYTPRHITFSCG